MSTDEEGGPIARLSNVIGALPSPRQMAAQWTPAQVQSVLTGHGAAMAHLGMTMDLAPVLDTANPANTIAGENYRSFSENGETAAAYGLAYAAGIHAGGIVPVAKHFPGLGHSSANTDTAPAVDPSLSQLETDDLIPFERAASAGLPAIMVGHPVVPGLTGNVPASLSPASYQFLRGALQFGGVAMTDDLDARAISAAGYSQPAATVTAIVAGADMAMIDAGAWAPTVNALSQAVNGGRLSLANVNASVGRILAAKGITVCSQPGWRLAIGAARDIAMGADGSLWAVGTNSNPSGFGIFQWKIGGWSEVRGWAATITVGPNGLPWVTTLQHQIYSWSGSGWNFWPAITATDIAVGPEGSVWAVGTVPASGGGGYVIYHWNGHRWDKVVGGALTITVGPNGLPWVTTLQHQIYSWSGSGWNLWPAISATDIAVGADGSVWAVGTSAASGGHGPIYHWTGHSWTPVVGGAVRITVGPYGLPWVTTSGYQIFAR
jgi:hypothetical protein